MPFKKVDIFWGARSTDESGKYSGIIHCYVLHDFSLVTEKYHSVLFEDHWQILGKA